MGKSRGLASSAQHNQQSYFLSGYCRWNMHVHVKYIDTRVQQNQNHITSTFYNLLFLFNDKNHYRILGSVQVSIPFILTISLQEGHRGLGGRLREETQDSDRRRTFLTRL